MKAHRFPVRQGRLFLFLLIFLAIPMSLSSALENHFLYFPLPRQDASPHQVGLDYEDVFFQAKDGTALTGWLIPGAAGSPLVLFCMGNAGNISHRLETIQMLHELGVAVFIFNYRGYGQSEGQPTETGLYLDVNAAMQEVLSRGWRADQVVIFGRSLGAAVGLEAALAFSPGGLIMESAFTSITAMGRHHYPFLNLFLGWLIDAQFDNLRKISSLQSPLLLIHGTQDQICPPEMAESLFARAPEPKELFWVQQADHNNGYLVGGESYRTVLRRSLQQWVQRSFVSESTPLDK